MSKILSIFRVPKSVIAVSDDVNRANAETAAYSFARWTINPKMRRIVEQLNEFLVPMFGDDLFLDFEDPVPENAEMKIKKYTAGLNDKSGWMTINEVREAEGMEPIEDGDEVYRAPIQTPSSTEGTEPVEPQKQMIVKNKNKKDKYPEQRLYLNAKTKGKREVKKVQDGIRKIIEAHLKEKQNGAK